MIIEIMTERPEKPRMIKSVMAAEKSAAVFFDVSSG